MSATDFTLDPKDMPFFMFESGGTSCARIDGVHEDGERFEQDTVAIHVHGKHFIKGSEVPDVTDMLVSMRIEDAVQLLDNLFQTCKDYKEKNGG